VFSKMNMNNEDLKKQAEAMQQQQQMEAKKKEMVRQLLTQVRKCAVCV
jgi:hypothetical protein